MSIDTRELDERQREAWRRSAQGWQRRQESMREKTAEVSKWMVDGIDPQPGDRVLEVAAGPGETGFIAAQRVGSEGRLVCSDQSPEMLEVARRRAAELGLNNVDFEVVEAQEMNFEPGRFDGALCRWGYMLMTDPDEALRRTRRALNEAGRLALATWDMPDSNLWLVAPMVELVARELAPPPDPARPGPFALCDAEDLDQRLREAGFVTANVDKLVFRQRYASFDDYWAEMLDLAAPISAVMASLDTDTQVHIRDATREALNEFTAQDGTIDMPACALVALAEV